MQYTAEDIRAAMRRGEIRVEPFDEAVNIKDNFLELHLGRHVAVVTGPLDCAAPPPEDQIRWVSMPPKGWVMPANTLVLGATWEWTWFGRCQAQLHGKSSLGRLGLAVHITAGIGDAGFGGHWTLELWSPHPIRIYPGMPIAQIEARGFGPESRPSLYAGGYCNAREEDPKPRLSRMHMKARTSDWLTIPD